MEYVNSSHKPILITGSHRCGSTWLASLLGASADTTVLQEPFNIAPHFYSLGGVAKLWFSYVPDLNEADAKAAFQRVLDRKAGRVYERRQPERYFPWLRKGRLIIKDPIAAFSSEWLSSAFDLEVLVLVRHPAAFAASLKRLSWEFPFHHLLEQPSLMNNVLAPYRDAVADAPADVVDQAALLWLLIYGALVEFSKRNSSWIVVKHEDLSRNPVGEISALYERLGLHWDDGVAEALDELCGAANPVDPATGIVHELKRNSVENISRWKKVLTETEVERVRRLTAPIADLFYENRDW